MSLSAYLTRDEWNAAYFAGVRETLKSCDLSQLLRRGISALAAAGYTFKGVRVGEAGEAFKTTLIDDPENVEVLVEFLQGTFDVRQRAAEVVALPSGTFGSYDWSWLCNRCFDDSCDLVHCADCGQHTVGNELIGGLCQTCFDNENHGPPTDVQAVRSLAADKALAEYQFDPEVDGTVSGVGSWSGDGDGLVCLLSMEDPDFTPYKRAFIVRFVPNTARVTEAYPGDPQGV